MPSTLTWLLTACLAVGPVACATAPRPPETPAPVSQPPIEQAGMAAATQPVRAPEVVDLALRRFATSVDALEGPPDPSHQHVVRALRAAADALEVVDASSEHAAAGPSAAADRIEGSAPDSGSHADDLLLGLRAAQSRLRALRAERDRTAALEAALADLDTEVRALGSGRPLLEQQLTTARAFRALADAVFVAAGHDAPFAGQRRSALAKRSVAELMDQLRSDTSALASADMTTVRTRAAEGMLSLAELVSVVGGTTGGTQGAKEIIFQAERLRREQSAPFARSQWVGRGLLAALQALDSLETCHADRVDDWVEMARRAATDLPEHGTLSFQHARVQDAFRATVDAFGVALLDGSCPAGANTAGSDQLIRLGAESR